MCYNLRVIDRNVGRTALKISHGVATFLHQLTDQLVGLDDRALGVINEAALQIFPGLTEPGGVRRRQRYDSEELNPLFARLEFRFGLCSASEIIDGSAVFRTKAFLESQRLFLFFVAEPCRKCNHYEDHNPGKNDPCLGVYRMHVWLLFWLILPSSSPKVTAASAEHYDQQDDDNDR